MNDTILVLEGGASAAQTAQISERYEIHLSCERTNLNQKIALELETFLVPYPP